ncbi:tetratricopeptide repeat protein [Deltaproteobacteria bacterium OttesenSCG-928-M10]|nr:tetratricopeptide repeat protein [Deltaproteobacteria bacterium OttesenSCG-928-M10]
MQNKAENVQSPAAEFDHVTEGERLYAEGRVDEAKAMFQAAAEYCPGNAMAWNNLGVLAMNSGEDRLAENYLRQALEVRNDLLEARFNLVEIYGFRGQWNRAARELQKVLEIKPADLPTTKRLAQVYLNMGEADKAQSLLSESKGLGAMKAFIDSLWLGIKYFSMADDLSARDKMEKFVGAVLKFLDGHDGRGPRYKLVSTDQETGEEVVLEDFYDSFYYKEGPSMTLAGEAGGEKSGPELVLTIGDHDDWNFFREALRAEMRSEGGCLGDFTQTRKVFRHESRLAKYSLPATLKYFQDNVGPCDCHVLRAVLV